MHIDACMGGFLLPFLEDFSHINFSLEGVTSISMDSHKYGYAPKGSSVLLFRDVKIKKYQHHLRQIQQLPIIERRLQKTRKTLNTIQINSQNQRKTLRFLMN